MLVLSRKLGEEIRIGEDIVITLVACRGSTARIGITAPRALRILRTELMPLSKPEATTDAK